MITIDDELDARGLNCPLPVMHTKKQLRHMAVGQHLRVITTDPKSVEDMATLTNYSGVEMVESSEANGDFVFIVKKTR